MNVLIISWIIFISIWAFLMMGYDKKQSKKRGRRIPEKTLWLFAIVGGGIGAYLGMMAFSHKTRHTEFRIGFLVLALLDIGIIIYLLGIGPFDMNSV
ncbi:DUF1294 domain-containing protein [Sporosarcina sp. ACRSL]|uniref:DUF1294 domain-containing protein n=1 Tax=Sporosarcina sp. ACRSL TaxID=2918215 RepID=UPI001EF64513|nr:DUF1294 domain-containing protein [Sporosarcina sp. ACRSL]MCG7346058.1 DUF1294 domain-containing protein [Sporosarcina sp. ACRSL]